MSNRLVAILSLSTMFLLGVTVFGAGSSQSGNEQHQKTFSAEPGTVLKIYNKDGNVDVSSWDRDFVAVDTNNKQPNIEVTTGKESVIRVNDKMNLKITVPKGVQVTRIETTKAGTINVANVSGDVDAYTASGDVKINGVNGFVKGETKSGKINITGVKGLCGAVTNMGDISVEVPAIREALDIKCHFGNITVFLSPNVAAELVANAPHGKVTYKDLPLNQSSKTTVTGKLGEGSGKINIETEGGSITLNKLP